MVGCHRGVFLLYSPLPSWLADAGAVPLVAPRAKALYIVDRERQLSSR